jgi:hypothetical protein
VSLKLETIAGNTELQLVLPPRRAPALLNRVAQLLRETPTIAFGFAYCGRGLLPVS